MNTALAFKAEVVLGLQLVARHRAPRLGLLMAGSLVLAMLAGGSAAGAAAYHRTILLISGSLGAMAGSRLLAQGGSLAAARRAASGVFPPVGRVAGAMLFIGPILLAVCIAVPGTVGSMTSTLLVAAVYGATVAATSMALSPVTGASGAAALGFLAAFLGEARPSQIGAILGAWPALRTPAVLLWNVLPLSWRAGRWLTSGPARGDPWVFLVWLLVGFAVSTWAIERFAERGEPGAS